MKRRYIAYMLILICICPAGCAAGGNNIPAAEGNSQNTYPAQDSSKEPPVDDPEAPDPCDHPQFRIAVDSLPVLLTVSDWYYANNESRECEVCGNYSIDTVCSQPSFEECLTGLENGDYDVILVPCSETMLSEPDTYVVTPIQRDGVVFIRSNSTNTAGFSLSDEKIRLAFTTDETVCWDDAGTDPIIPASGWFDTEPSMWQHIDYLFGFSASSPNVIFSAEHDDNCMWTISESGRTGAGLWPCYFSSLFGEVGIGNGGVVGVNGIFPTWQSISSGVYPYAFGYYAVYSPDNIYAEEISAFAAELQKIAGETRL